LKGLGITMPREMFTDKSFENLHKIVLAKGKHIARANRLNGFENH